MSTETQPIASARSRSRTRSSWIAYFATAAACTVTTGIGTPLLPYFDLANIVMLFLLTVVLVAVRLGRGPAVTAAFLSVALFDFFFVPPRFSFTVHDVQYLFTFAVMLVVALIIGELTARLREQAQIASAKEARTRALYEMARELSGISTSAEVAAMLQRSLKNLVGAEGVIFLARDDGRLEAAGDPPKDILVAFDPPIVELAQSDGRYINDVTKGYFPLKSSGRVWGVMAVIFKDDLLALDEHCELLEAVAALIAIVVERLR